MFRQRPSSALVALVLAELFGAGLALALALGSLYHPVAAHDTLRALGRVGMLLSFAAWPLLGARVARRGASRLSQIAVAPERVLDGRR